MFALIIPLGTIPGMPDDTLPGMPGYPSQGGPFPGQLPSPGGPGAGVPTPPIHLPPQVGTLPIYPASPSHPIALPPGSVWPPLGPSVPSGKALALVAISGVGYRWTVIDATLSPGNELPGQPAMPDQGLPPTAQPKR